MAGVDLLQIENGLIELDAFSLEVGNWNLEPGLHLVSGPNGSGKSTFLRVLLGLQGLSRGVRIAELGSDSFGYVPQNYRQSLIPWENCKGNFDRIGNINVEAALKILQRLGFRESDFGKRPGQLSGGQCQRIAVVREIALSPTVLILDEPFASLDSSSIDLVSSLLVDFLRGGGSILMASHQPPKGALQDSLVSEIEIFRPSDNLAKIRLCD